MPCLISSNKAKKKRYLSYDDLPLGTKDAFKKIVIPLSLKAAGTKKPWENPIDDAIISIWNYVYDNEIHIEGGDVECDKFLVAKTLVSGWTHFLCVLTFGRYPDRTCDIKLAPQVRRCS